MPLNADLVGKTYPAASFVLDAGTIRAFADAIGHPTSDVPPTIVIAPEFEAGLRNVVADPDLGLELAGVLHGEQEYRWERPLAAGETLTAEATIEEIRRRAGLGFLVLRTELLDEAGVVVAVGRSTLLVREGR
jgi:hypothetical protein